jgi:hypothetical protein
VVLTKILPDVFLAIEFGAVRRQLYESDIVGDFKSMGGMPTCAIHYDHGMATRRDMAGYFKEMLVHRISVGKGQNQCRPCAFGWADSPKDVSAGIALIGDGSWA